MQEKYLYFFCQMMRKLIEIGFTNILGRAGVCWISDLKWINSIWACSFLMAISAITVLLIPICNSYTTYMIVSGLFGFFSGAIQMKPIIMIELLGKANLSQALGFCICFCGIGILIGAPMAGIIYDITKSYDVAFYTSGGSIFLSSFILSFIPYLRRRK